MPQGKRVLIITHSFVTGPPHELRDYLRDKGAATAYIDHPFSYAPVINSSITLYRDGKAVQKRRAPALRGPEFALYIKDFLLTLYFAIRLRQRFDVCFGVDNLNAFAGWLLKGMGLVDKVIYYSQDYTPKRFPNPLMNWLYHFLDRFCCYRCDGVWFQTEEMFQVRCQNGLDSSRCRPRVTVPGGNHFRQENIVPLVKIDRHRLVYLGHLREHKGLELLLESLPQVVARVPQTSLLVIGGGPLEGKLKAQALGLGLASRVTFTGMIEDHREVERLLATCGVGVAPYVPDPNSFTFYTSPGKPTAYMAAGLPVVIVRVPPIAREIEEWGAGIAIDYDQGQLVAALVRLLEDDAFHARCRERAIAYSANFTWERIFDQAFRDTNLLLEANVRAR